MKRCAPAVTLATLLVLVLACSKTASPGRYAAVNGIRMYYETYGRGPVLVLLHGGAGNGLQFSGQVPYLRKHFRLIVPDECAQGRSTDRPGPLTYHAMAEDVIALMDRLHVRRASVMGWSDGGIVGLDMAIHHPARVGRLVTFGANFTPDGLNPEDVAWNARAGADDFGPIVRHAYQALAPDPSHYEVAMDKIIAMWRTQPRFTLAELGSIRARTLIAAGEHDVVRLEHTALLARAIPGARLWIVPGASHSVIQEKTELVNRTVLDFLRR